MFKRGSWPKEKCEAFSRDYLAGTPLRDMQDRYDSSSENMVMRARKLGLPKRNRLETQWALAGGEMRPWLYQRDQLESLIAIHSDQSVIASALGRTVHGVRHERRRLGYISDGRAADVDQALSDTMRFADGLPIVIDALEAGMHLRDAGAFVDLTSKKYLRMRRTFGVVKPKKKKKRATVRDARSRILSGDHE